MRWKLFGVALVVTVAAVDAQQAPSLAGRWEGVLAPDESRNSRELRTRREGTRLPTVVVINGADGNYTGTWTSVAQGNATTRIDKVEVNGVDVLINVRSWGGRYEGTMSEDGSKLEGRWIQSGIRVPFTLTRVAESP